MECGFDTHKNALINNLVILFDFFCAVESIYSFFQTDRFYWFNIYRIEQIRVIICEKKIQVASLAIL